MILYILTFIIGLIFGGGIFFIISIKTEIMDAIKQKIELKKYDREQRIQFERDAKLMIQKDLMKDYSKHLRQKELDKLTGKNKKDKLKKFADAFSMSSGGQGGQDFLNKMGMSDNNQNTSNDKINQMMGVSNENKMSTMWFNENRHENSNNTQSENSSNDNINRMLGLNENENKRSKEEEFERLKNLMK